MAMSDIIIWATVVGFIAGIPVGNLLGDIFRQRRTARADREHAYNSRVGHTIIKNGEFNE